MMTGRSVLPSGLRIESFVHLKGDQANYFRSLMEDLFLDEDSTDLALIVGSQRLNLHQSQLSRNSELLRRLFEVEASFTGGRKRSLVTVYCHGFGDEDVRHFRTVMEILYTGRSVTTLGKDGLSRVKEIIRFLDLRMTISQESVVVDNNPKRKFIHHPMMSLTADKCNEPTIIKEELVDDVDADDDDDIEDEEINRNCNSNNDSGSFHLGKETERRGKEEIDQYLEVVDNEDEEERGRHERSAKQRKLDITKEQRQLPHSMESYQEPVSIFGPQQSWGDSGSPQNHPICPPYNYRSQHFEGQQISSANTYQQSCSKDSRHLYKPESPESSMHSSQETTLGNQNMEISVLPSSQLQPPQLFQISEGNIDDSDHNRPKEIAAPQLDFCFRIVEKTVNLSQFADVKNSTVPLSWHRWSQFKYHLVNIALVEYDHCGYMEKFGIDIFFRRNLRDALHHLLPNALGYGMVYSPKDKDAYEMTKRKFRGKQGEPKRYKDAVFISLSDCINDKLRSAKPRK